MLKTAFERGRSEACTRFGVKVAAVPLARPMPRVAPAMSAAPAVPRVQPGFQLTPHEEAQAQRIRQNPGSGQHELGLDRDTQNAQFMQQHGVAPSPTAPAAPAAPAARARGAGGFMRPVRRGLGLAALGAGGAMAYGLHHQHQIDEEKNPLVYVPMQGGFQ